MKKFYSFFIIVVLLTTNGLMSAEFGFKKDNLYVGPTVGLNSYFASSSLGFGARGEYGLMDNINIGSFNGSIGVGVDLFYTNFSETYFANYKWDYTFFSFIIFASYHFSPKSTWDPYVHLGLGYNSISYTDSWNGGGSTYSAGYGSGIGTTADIGINYRLSDGMSIRAALGWPILLAAGIDFNLGEMGWQAKK